MFFKLLILRGGGGGGVGGEKKQCIFCDGIAVFSFLLLSMLAHQVLQSS